MATKPVAARLDERRQRQFKRFMDVEGYDKPSDATEAVILLGLQRWEERNDPAHSWLLHVGIAAGLWSILSVLGTVQFGTPPWDVSAFSIWMAFVFLTAHAVQLTRDSKWFRRISTPRRASQ